MLLYIIVHLLHCSHTAVFTCKLHTLCTLVHTHILVLYLFTCTCTHPTSYIIYTHSPHITANMHVLLYISYHTSILSHISYHCSLIRLVHNCTYSSCRYIFYITVHQFLSWLCISVFILGQSSSFTSCIQCHNNYIHNIKHTLTCLNVPHSLAECVTWISLANLRLWLM